MISVNFDLEEFREIIREEVERMSVNQSLKDQYEPVLIRKDLRRMFQASESAITKLINIPSFPKFPHIQGRYPRDLVIEWMADETNQEIQRRLGLNKKFRAI